MALVVGVSVIGLQSVGMLLVVAILISPAAAARFWTNNLKRMTILAAIFGALGSILGVMASAALPRIAAGSVIVLFGSAIFLVSLLFGTERGALRRAIRHRGLAKRIGRHDLLRAIYEEIEPTLENPKSPSTVEITSRPFTFDRILQMRTWNAPELERYLRDAVRVGMIRADASGRYFLSDEGAVEAQRVVREHRLWELYLISYADVAPGMVDRDADRIEHALEPEVVAELTSMLSARYPKPAMPPSPHPIETAGAN
jgi:manganese/zinc/iron transport system permease protein